MTFLDSRLRLDGYVSDNNLDAMARGRSKPSRFRHSVEPARGSTTMRGHDMHKSLAGVGSMIRPVTQNRQVSSACGGLGPGQTRKSCRAPSLSCFLFSGSCQFACIGAR